MKTAKEISVLSVFVALLIGGQFVLSAVSGIEIVTVLVTSFCFYFGVCRGCIVATAFSLLRCFIFGFFPTVIILYLTYYNLVAVVFGVLGKAFNRSLDVKKLIVTVIIAAVMTVLFTMIDNVLTPLFYGYTLKAAKAYFVASFTAMIPQTICAVITVSVFFAPLLKVYKVVKI